MHLGLINVLQSKVKNHLLAYSFIAQSRSFKLVADLLILWKSHYIVTLDQHIMIIVNFVSSDFYAAFSYRTQMFKSCLSLNATGNTDVWLAVLILGAVECQDIL